MRIYRGPSKGHFNDAKTVRTDSIDTSLHRSRPWTGTLVLRADATKDGYQRNSVVYVELGEQDVIDLHESLVRGLHERNAQLSASLDKAEQALTEIELETLGRSDTNSQTIADLARKGLT